MKIFTRNDDPTPAPLEDRLEAAQESAREAEVAYQEAVQRRQQRQARLRELESAAADARAEAEASALVPGGAAATRTESRVEEVEAEIATLEAEEDRARERWEQAKANAREVAREVVPDLAEDARKAQQKKIQALADLGRAALRAASDVETARGEMAEARDRLERARRAASPSHNQRRELQAFLEGPNREAPPEAEVGWLVIRTVRWFARLDRDDVRAVLDEHDVPPRDGSVIGHPMIAALDEIGYRLHRGQSLRY